MARAVTVIQPTQQPITRAAFVRSKPIDMPANEVIELGRRVGLDIKPSDVHASRFYMRKQLEEQGMPVPPTVRSNARQQPAEVEEDDEPEQEPVRQLKAPTALAGKYFKVRGTPELLRQQLEANQFVHEGSVDEQLKSLILRVGTDKARGILEAVEEAVSALR